MYTVLISRKLLEKNSSKKFVCVLLSSIEVALSVLSCFGRPKDEAESDYVGLIVVDSVAADDSFTFFELVSDSFPLLERAFDFNDRPHVFVVELDGLDELRITAHLYILDYIVRGQARLLV